MPVKIFICYAHKDELLLKKLKTHLSPLQQKIQTKLSSIKSTGQTNEATLPQGTLHHLKRGKIDSKKKKVA